MDVVGLLPKRLNEKTVFELLFINFLVIRMMHVSPTRAMFQGIGSISQGS